MTPMWVGIAIVAGCVLLLSIIEAFQRLKAEDYWEDSR